MPWIVHNRIYVFLGLATLVIFFATRLFNIMELPIFTDEALYVRWAQIAKNDATWRFISLTDGKQPSFIWLTMVLMRFVSDPLLAGRLVSVGAGMLSMVGLFFLGRELFKNSWIGLLCAGFYVLYPFALVYDRMALYDSLVGAFAVWSLYLTILLARSIRLDVALILGMVLGGWLLTKTSAFFGIFLLPFSLLLFDWRAKEKRMRILRWLGLVLIATLSSLGYYSILKLSPHFFMIAEKNALFIYHVAELIPYRAFEAWSGNLVVLLQWFIAYATLPLFIFMLLTFFLSKKYVKEEILLFTWFIVPIVYLALFGRILHPRFIFFMTLPLLPLAAIALFRLYAKFKHIKALLLVAFLTLLPVVRSDYFILTDFARAPIPFADIEQYSDYWPAGGGIREIISYLQREAQRGKIIVVSEGTYGSLPTTMLDLYAGDNENIEKRGMSPIPEEMPQDLLEKSKTFPVYVIFNQLQEPPKRWPLELVVRYQKGRGDSYASLYKVANSL